MPPGAKSEIEAAERLVRIESSIEATRIELGTQISTLRLDLARFFSEHADHESRIRGIESLVTIHDERLRHISKQASTWNLGNSIGTAIATAIAWFK